MGFKSLDTFNEEKFRDFFVLRDDNDSAQVIFLYRDRKDVLVGNVHYVKSANYSGYVHCCGAGCPACAKGIRVQNKIFVPLYNITENKIQYWDRTTNFEPQLERDIFKNYPNPSEFVFTVTRHGAARSMDTTYEILATARNTSLPYDAILAQFGISLPEGYDKVCRDLYVSELHSMLDNQSPAALVPTAEFNYQAVPRSGYAPIPTVPVPEVNSAIPSMPELTQMPEIPTVPEVAPLAEIPSDVTNASTDDDELEDPDF